MSSTDSRANDIPPDAGLSARLLLCLTNNGLVVGVVFFHDLTVLLDDLSFAVDSRAIVKSARIKEDAPLVSEDGILARLSNGFTQRFFEGFFDCFLHTITSLVLCLELLLLWECVGVIH